MRRALGSATLVLLAAGCGGTTTVTVTETRTETVTQTTEAHPTALRIYLLASGKVAPVARSVESSGAVATAVLATLATGPTAAERARGLVTAVPGGLGVTRLTIAGGVAHLQLDGQLTREALGQVVYTLTQFTTVHSVEIDGARHTRATLEEVTPAILVESPLPGTAVSSPLELTGTANTFEASFNVELLRGATTVKSTYVTATSGSGTRGTFDTSIAFPADGGGPLTLVVFEPSAEDGSRTNVVEVPLTPAP